MACECGGKGFSEMTVTDLFMLYKIMKVQRNDVAKGTVIAIKNELKRRGYLGTVRRFQTE